MRVMHILIDSYHPENGGTCPELFDLDEITRKFDNVVKIDSVDSSEKKFISPVMWARTFIGHKPQKEVPRYNPNMKDEKAVDAHGYTSLDKDEFIWNKLAKNGVKSFCYPYYLMKQLPSSSLVDSELCTLYLRDFESDGYDYIDKLNRTFIKDGMTYSCFCDRFDYGFTKADKLILNDEWNSEDPESISTIIEYVEAIVLDNLYDSMKQNSYIWHDICKKLYDTTSRVPDDEDVYMFLGLIESDCINHFTHPYSEFNGCFKTYVTSILSNLIYSGKPDVLIIHGDHNMVPTYRPRVKYKFKAGELSAVRAYYSPVPFYTDHGNKVGGYVLYNNTPETISNVPKLLSDTEGLFMDRVYNWVTTNLRNGGNS